jgi:hypothetical protein
MRSKDAGNRHRSQKRILLVDQNRPMAERRMQLLSTMGYKVDYAYSDIEADSLVPSSPLRSGAHRISQPHRCRQSRLNVQEIGANDAAIGGGLARQASHVRSCGFMPNGRLGRSGAQVLCKTYQSLSSVGTEMPRCLSVVGRG